MDSKLTEKGQMTLPKEARDHLNLKPGDRVKIFTHPDGHVVLLPKVPISALKGMLKTHKHATIEEMDEAIRATAVERYRGAARK
ncbi:MAG TPA: AbrB/MazE/SpoVT family DNA-binding domain-containing protein [Rhizomicrobium sp.]|nr:AbrB/MazE/SpoVT family DNA-binding domain-containing protein [Rhizomicrobium sp.]